MNFSSWFHTLYHNNALMHICGFLSGKIRAETRTLCLWWWFMLSGCEKSWKVLSAKKFAAEWRTRWKVPYHDHKTFSNFTIELMQKCRRCRLFVVYKIFLRENKPQLCGISSAMRTKKSFIFAAIYEFRSSFTNQHVHFISSHVERKSVENDKIYLLTIYNSVKFERWWDKIFLNLIP